MPGTNLFDKTCFECGHSGYMRVACPQLIGGGRGRGRYWRGRGRGCMFEDHGGIRGRGMRHVGRANTSAIEEASQTVSVEMSVEDLEKWRQFKKLSIGERQSSEASTSTASANFSGTWD